MRTNPAERPAAVVPTLPKPWEEEASFHDALYEWMSRAPWLALSAVAHAMVFLLLSLVPWSLLREERTQVIETAIARAVEEPYEDPPPEEPRELEEVEPLEEPELQDATLDERTEDATDDPFEQAVGDPDLDAISPFEDQAFNAVLGIGGLAGGKLGGRFGGRDDLRRRGGEGTQRALTDGLEWLARHQAEDGRWDCDGFMESDSGHGRCDGPGQPEHDVGVTALALLAFLGDGHTTRTGLYRERVARGIQWLRARQDPETGLVGEPIGKSFLYDHAIATLALCEAYYFSKSPLLRITAQKAVGYVTRARNPYGAWRYDVPPNGENDSSVTGWMVFALKAAEEAGLTVDSQAFDDSLAWFDEVTDAATGRVGYDSVGSASARVPGVNDRYPTERTETMTAVGLLCRFFLGQEPERVDLMNRHADLMLRALPEWDPDGLTNDVYYWYYGTYAMFQMGGSHWNAWNRAMKQAVVDSQRKDGCAKGSWDPIGPWGHAGGRVYSTAACVLCLEVYFRYARVLGAR